MKPHDTSAASPGPASLLSVASSLDLSWITDGRLVVVGVGGIGSFFVRPLAMFLSSLWDLTVRLVLIDGDSFEERNRERMEIPEFGNKADVVCRRLSDQFGRPRFSIRPVDKYLGPDNVGELILPHDVVFSCVDNHATRKVLSDRCQSLDNIVLFSAGNDGVEDEKTGTYGNIQVFLRRGKRDVTAPLTRFHPEILHPADELPGPSCEDLAATTAPQIVFTNFFAAAALCGALYRLLSGQIEEMYDEACFDIHEARLVPHSFDRS